MTRKDYILIEGILQDEYRWAPNPSKELGAIYRVAYMLGDALAKQDKNFDRAHFLAVVRGEKELTSRPKHAFIDQNGKKHYGGIRGS